jgi:minor histocompatibility antigen H13
MFPVYGSAVLFGLYVLFKFIDKSLLSSLFNVYFSVLGLLCLMGLLEDIF